MAFNYHLGYDPDKDYSLAILAAKTETERAALRKEYLDGFRENMRQVLEGVVIQRPDGTKEPLKKKQDKH